MEKKNVKHIFCCLIFIFSFYKGITQKEGSPVQITHYTTDNGLPHDFTYHITQDKDNRIWIGSDNGLVVFDGEQFEIIDTEDGLETNFVIDVKKYIDDIIVMAVWRDGIYFLEGDSISKMKGFDESEHRFESFYPFDKNILTSNFGNYELYTFLESEQVFKRKVFRLESSERNQLKLGDSMSKGPVICTRPKLVDDQLFFFNGYNYNKECRNLKGVYKTSKDLIFKGVFPFLNDKVVFDVGKLSNSTYYALTKDQLIYFEIDGIYKIRDFNLQDLSLRLYGSNESFELFVAYDKFDNKDRIFISYFDENLIEVYLEENFLIGDLYLDKDQNFWITTKANGVYKISRKSKLVHRHLLPNHLIEDITFMDEKIIMGSHNTLFLYNIEKDSVFTKTLLTRARDIRICKQFENTISINGGDSILQREKVVIDNVLVKTYLPTKKKYQNCMLEYTSQKWSLYKDGKLVIDKEIAKPKTKINTIDLIKEHIYVGTNKGVQKYNLEGEHLVDFELNKIKRNARKIIYDPLNGIWILAGLDLFLYNDDGLEKISKGFKGLSSAFVNDVFLDHLGIIWVGTQNGYSVFKDNLFYNFYKGDGFLSSYVTKIIEDDHHRIWISGNKGVIQIDNSNVFKPFSPPTLKLNKTKANKLSVSVVDFSGFTKKTEYSLNDDDWKELKEEVIDFEKYAFGEYQVQIRSRNELSDWVYSEKVIFDIKEEWYRTKWFISGCFLILVFGIYWLRSMQLKNVRRRNAVLENFIQENKRLELHLTKVRENVAKDFHDELGNKLAGIMVRANSILQNKEPLESKNVKDTIMKIKKDADNLFLGIKDFVWAIDARSDLLNELISYLTDFGYELFEGTKLDFSVVNNTKLTNVRLPNYWSRELLLLFKEVLTNVLVHSKATRAILQFEFSSGILEIVAKDNGKGFCENELKRKSGLINMKKRAEKIGGELKVSSQEGTTVCFRGKI